MTNSYPALKFHRQPLRVELQVSIPQNTQFPIYDFLLTGASDNVQRIIQESIQKYLPETRFINDTKRNNLSWYLSNPDGSHMDGTLELNMCEVLIFFHGLVKAEMGVGSDALVKVSENIGQLGKLRAHFGKDLTSFTPLLEGSVTKVCNITFG
jgi:hypothetical protein